MMGLMVENVGNRCPQGKLVSAAATEVDEWGGEPLLSETGDAGRKRFISEGALAGYAAATDFEELRKDFVPSWPEGMTL
jgi:hypothetical protein